MRNPRPYLVALLVAALPAVAVAQQPEKKPEAPKPEAPKVEAPKPDSAKADSAKVEAKAEVKAEAKAEQPKTEAVAGGDVAAATALQVIAAVTDAGATAKALEGATIASVRLVNVKDILDAANQPAFDAALTKNEADIQKLRAAVGGLESAKAALVAANVQADRIVGASVAGGVATLYYQP